MRRLIKIGFLEHVANVWNANITRISILKKLENVTYAYQMYHKTILAAKYAYVSDTDYFP